MPCISLQSPPKSRFFFKQILRCSPRSWRHPPTASQAGDRLVATIRALSSARLISAAFSAFSNLRRFLSHPFSPHLEHPISSLFAASSALRLLSHGSSLHALALSLGLLPKNPHTVSRVAAFYAACGLLDDARTAVEDSTADLSFAWNIVISAYLKNGFSQDAIFSYRMMLERGACPDKFTYSSVLKACGELRNLELGKEVHRLLNFFDSNCDLFICNALLSMYAKCRAVNTARKVFDEMPKRDVISWNSMILGYTSEGRWEETSELLELMQRDGFELNSVTLNTIICGHVYFGNHKEALQLISHTRQRTDVWPVDAVSLVLGLKACTEIRLLKQGKEIHGLAIRSSCDRIENINNALITFYSKCYMIGYSSLLFKKSLGRSVVTWNAMIAAFAVTNNIQEATLVLQAMIGSRLELNYVTLITMLSLCADASELCYGKQLHCYAMKHGYMIHLPIANSIVNMYCKSGKLSIAQSVFNTMTTHDKISFTVLIAGYASQRDRMVTLKLFDEMVNQGIDPDHITFEMVCLAWSK